MSTPPDPFEFVKNLWAQMGIPGFAAGSATGMPSFAPEELAKRIGELRQIRQWLEINLNMLNLQVNGLEMQLSAIKGFNSSPGGEMAAQAAKAMQDAVSGNGAFTAPQQGFGANFGANPGYAQPGFGGFPFGTAPAATAAPAPEPPAAPPPAESPRPKSRAKKAQGDSAKAPAWPDPTSWMQTLQAEFVKNMKSVGSGSGPAAPVKAAAKKAAAKPAAGRATAKKRTRGSP